MNTTGVFQIVVYLVVLIALVKPLGSFMARVYEGERTTLANTRISPDGRWAAYVSDQSGRNEVYVRPFPVGDGKRMISVSGGIEPTWRGDGKEIYYIAPDGNLMAVPIGVTRGLEPGLPARLFQTSMTNTTISGYTRNQYLVTSDGQRFLINQPVGSTFPAPITVVVNWMAAVGM